MNPRRRRQGAQVVTALRDTKIHVVSRQCRPLVTASQKSKSKDRAHARAYRNTLAERPPPQAALRLVYADIPFGFLL
jgi:hypothetical protein